MIPHLALACLLVICPSMEQKEETARTLQQSFPREISDSPHDKVITLAIENDSMGGGTDQNYTSGVRLTYFDLNADFPAYADELADLIPTFDINRTSSVFYSLGQNLYTPENIEQRPQDNNDRPWAAFLYGSVGMATLTDNHIDEIEATLGVVGPYAVGEQAQKFIHSHIFTGAPTPKGWSNQLDNEPGLMLSWQRRWPLYWTGETAGMLFSASPYYGLTLGNVYTYANGGVNVRINPSKLKWEDMPIRVRPAMPGTGFFEIPENKWSWYLFGGVEGRAVGRNIFLDGNTFSDSHNVDKRYFVADANAGIAFTYGRTRLSYTLVYRTKEFHDQDQDQVFGALSLGYRF